MQSEWLLVAIFEHAVIWCTYFYLAVMPKIGLRRANALYTAFQSNAPILAQHCLRVINGMYLSVPMLGACHSGDNFQLCVLYALSQAPNGSTAWKGVDNLSMAAARRAVHVDHIEASAVVLGGRLPARCLQCGHWLGAHRWSSSGEAPSCE